MVNDCLRTVFTQTRTPSFEVIVVDNASGDGSEGIICAAFPSVRWIQMGYNSGFARANNEGIRQSAGEVVLLINSDTLVEDRAIEGCYREFAGSAYMACGVQLINPDRTSQISGSYFVRGGLNYLLPLPYLGALVRRAGRVSGAKVPNVPDARSLVEVDWINGAYSPCHPVGADEFLPRRIYGLYVEFLLADLENSPVAAEPKPAAFVIDHLGNVILAQAVRGGDGTKPAVFQPANAGARVTNPQTAVGGGGQATDGDGRRFCFRCFIEKLITIDTQKLSIGGANPDVSEFVFGQGSKNALRGRQLESVPVGSAKPLETVPCGRRIGRDPQISFGTDHQGLDPDPEFTLQIVAGLIRQYHAIQVGIASTGW